MSKDSFSELNLPLNLIFNQIQIPMWLLAVEPCEQLRFVAVNDVFSQITGYAKAQIEGHLMADLLPKTVFESTQPYRLQAIRTAQPVAYTRIGLLNQNEQITYQVQVIPQFNVAGQVTHLVGSAKDLTSDQLAYQEHQKYQQIFDHSLDAIVLADDHGQYVDVNPAACQMLGYSRAELLRMQVADITVDKPDERWQDFRQNGQQSDMILLRRKDQSQILVHYNAVAGILPGVHLSVFRDETEKYQRNQELMDSQNKLAAFFNSSTDINMLFAPDSTLLAFNESARLYIKTIFGYNPKINDKLSDYLKDMPERADNLNKSLRYALSGQELRKQVQSTFHGIMYWWDLTYAPAYNAQKQLIGVSCNVVNITERKVLEEQMMSQSAYLQGLVNATPSCIKTLDIDGTILAMNATGRQWLEADEPQDIIGKNVFSLVVPEHQAAYRAFHEQICQGQSGKLEFEIIGLKGTRCWVESNSVPFRNTNGQLLHLGVTNDISQRKQGELTMAKAVLAAEAANQAKSQFLANMSHEIRTPLNGLLGALQLIETTRLTEEQRQLTNLAHRSGQDLMCLLNDLLDFAKIEAGRLELERLPFNIEILLNEIVAIHQPFAASKSLSLSTLVDKNIPALVVGDPTRLRQVLNNLISNALKFTEQGYVQIQIKCLSSASQSRVTLQFAVLDTGIGIAAEQQEAIFAPFVQADLSITRKYGGTGLGLAITRRLVKEMGGDLALDSLVNQGTSFRVNLTLDIAVAENKQLVSERVPLNSHHFKGHILVAEDNPFNQLVIAKMLESLGLTVNIVADGLQALEALEYQAFDLVLMDMMMPVKDGLDATRQLRQSRSKASCIPIIAMTANTSEKDRQTCLDAGMNDFIPKPIDLNQLQQVLLPWLGHESEPRSQTIQTNDKTATLNLKVLAQLKNTMQDKYPDALDIFYRDTSKRLELLQQASSRDDRDSLTKIAHALKGSSSLMGADTLNHLCETLQYQAYTLPLSEIHTLLEQMTQAFKAVQRCLHDLEDRVQTS